MSVGDTDVDRNSYLLAAGATTSIARTTRARNIKTGRRLTRWLWVIGFACLVLHYLALFFLGNLSAVSLNGNGITTSSQHDHHRGRPRRQCSSPEYHSNVSSPEQHPPKQKQHPMSCPKAVSVGKSHVAGLSASPVYCGLCAATTTTAASSPSNISNNEQFMAHFQELVDQIKVYAQENQCQDQLTIYGNAFGTTYGEGHFFRYIWDRYDEVSATPTAQEQYSPCVFYFVLERTLRQIATRFPNGRNILWHNSAQQGKNQTSSSSFVGLFANPLLWEYTSGKSLVGVRQSILPYKSLRRNGKLIKMNPHLLFPWASRVLYMDSKLELRWRIGHRKTTINLDQFFFGQHNTNTTRSTANYVSDDHDDDSMSCASMILMPPWHKHTMVAATEPDPGPQQPQQSLMPQQLQLHQPPALSSFSFEPRDRFEAHCRAIQQSSRSDVSDSMMAVIRQCEAYTSQVRQDFLFQQTKSGRRESLSSSSVAVVSPLDAPLIDGAMLAWNLRTPQCRQFVADLTCTWLDEINCYSDRDQISWPYTLYQMQLVPFAVHHTHQYQVTTPINSTTYGTDTNHQGRILLEADEWDDNRDLYYGRLPTMTEKLKQQQHDDPNSTRLQGLSSLPRPLLHLHTSYCHWYFEEEIQSGNEVLKSSACQQDGAARK